MEIKFTTNYNCLGDYDECVLFEGTVKTKIGAKRAENKAHDKFERFRKLSPNYPFITSVKLTNGEWHDLRVCDPDVADFIDNPLLLNNDAIKNYIESMENFIANLEN